MTQNSSAKPSPIKPTNAFVGASWAALLAGTTAFVVGLWNAELALSEKGYYLTILMFGLFSAVSLQKSVRDQLEGITVSPIYFGLAWISVGASLILLTVGLWNAHLMPSEKGFYAMSFTLSVFAAVTVQKNVRDLALFDAWRAPAERLVERPVERLAVQPSGQPTNNGSSWVIANGGEAPAGNRSAS